MQESTITLGGGCFWCLEAVFVRVRGVRDVESGYCNGHVVNPTYEQVCSGHTGHVEVVQLRYDPAVIGLTDILDIFFTIHDPTTLNRQGHDVGSQYRSGIYVDNAVDAQVARDAIARGIAQGLYPAPWVTEVLPRVNYSAAEDDHQDYFERHPEQGYCAFVVAPKVQKLRQHLSQWCKP